MKQKNGAWLLALAAMLCSIGGVCIKGGGPGGACAGTEPWPAAR